MAGLPRAALVIAALTMAGMPPPEPLAPPSCGCLPVSPGNGGPATTTAARAHQVATTRYLRAVLKVADICATEPARAAQRLVDAGFAERSGYALQTLNEIPYDRWREFDPEDSMRFYALRLHEAGMIETTPNRGHRLAFPE